jgi:hypothetical protein
MFYQFLFMLPPIFPTWNILVMDSVHRINKNLDYQTFHALQLDLNPGYFKF